MPRIQRKLHAAALWLNLDWMCVRDNTQQVIQNCVDHAPDCLIGQIQAAVAAREPQSGQIVGDSTVPAMSKTKAIVIPVALTEDDSKAVDFAVDSLYRTGDSIHLVHVLRTREPGNEIYHGELVLQHAEPENSRVDFRIWCCCRSCRYVS